MKGLFDPKGVTAHRLRTAAVVKQRVSFLRSRRPGLTLRAVLGRWPTAGPSRTSATEAPPLPSRVNCHSRRSLNCWLEAHFHLRQKHKH